QRRPIARVERYQSRQTIKRVKGEDTRKNFGTRKGGISIPIRIAYGAQRGCVMIGISRKDDKCSAFMPARRAKLCFCCCMGLTLGRCTPIKMGLCLTLYGRIALMVNQLRVWVLALLVAIGLSGCGYNEIQRLDEQVKAAWSQTLNQYERRADLVPKLVSSVDAFMVNERTVLREVTEARAQVGRIQIDVNDLDNPELMARFEQAQSQLSSA